MPDNTEDTDHLLYVSLLILGLDAANLECKLKTPVNEKCFSRINRRLGDAILHFLFVTLDRVKARKVFSDCWPLLDKKHESQFYKAAFEFYKTIQQSYKQPTPTVMAKTFMAPGGPRFTSTLMTLSRTALHALITKKDMLHPVLYSPNHSRCKEQNWQALQILQAFKVSHSQHYIEYQKACQSVLFNLKTKSRELCSSYRRLCKENEKVVADFTEALNGNEKLSQQQRDAFVSSSSSSLHKALSDDITRMNDSVNEFWVQLDHYLQVDQCAWKVLCPLLDGTTALSHVNGSMYSPQVPDVIRTSQSNGISKVKLQGLYREDKLDLLSLVKYCNLTISSLLDISRSTNTQRHTDSSGQISSLSALVTSLGETVHQLTDKLTTLLPTFEQTLSSNFTTTSSLPTPDHTGLAGSTQLDSLCLYGKSTPGKDIRKGKIQLCPPTPPFILLRQQQQQHELVTSRSTTQHIPLLLPPECVAMSRDTVTSDIQDMNIKKRDKTENIEECQDFTKYSKQHLLPIHRQHNNNNKNSLHSEYNNRLIDVTTSPKLFEYNTPLRRDMNNSHQNNFTTHEKMTSVFNTPKSVTSQKGSSRRLHDPLPDLQKMLTSITQTPSPQPLKGHYSPFKEKIPTTFDRCDVSPGNNYFVSTSPNVFSFESRKLNELRDHSKANLNILTKSKESDGAKYNNNNNTLIQHHNGCPQVSHSKPSFISYVENLKKSQSVFTPQTQRNNNNEERTSITNNNNNDNNNGSLDINCNDWPTTEGVNKEYYENFTRMQNLLNLDEEITKVTSKHSDNLLQSDEVFVSPNKDEGRHFGIEKRAAMSLLPKASLFDTLTDSILVGELDASLLADKKFGKQIRRESLSSRQQSVSNMRRLSLECSKHSEELVTFGYEDTSGILDETDKCLLSPSFF